MPIVNQPIMAPALPPAIPAITSELLDAAELSPLFRTPPVDPLSSITETTDMGVFAAHVQRNEPCVLRGILKGWPPVCGWSDEHLRATCGSTVVPTRIADSPGRFGDQQRPGVYASTSETMELAELLDTLEAAQRSGGYGEVYAAQLRLRTSLPQLYAETRPPPACLEVLGPLWRNSPSVYLGCGARSPLHFDCLENLLCMVRGRKNITLWHPAYGAMLYPGGGGSGLFSCVPDALADEIDNEAFPQLHLAQQCAVSVELRAGDALYLPCGWWHDVRTPKGERSLSISYWTQQPPGKAWVRAPFGEVDDDHDHYDEAERRAFAVEMCVMR